MALLNTIIGGFLIAWGVLVALKLWGDREYFNHHAESENRMFVAKAVLFMPLAMVGLAMVLIIFLGFLLFGIRAA